MPHAPSLVQKATAAALERVQQASELRRQMRQAEAAAEQARMLRVQRAQRGEVPIGTLPVSADADAAVASRTRPDEDGRSVASAGGAGGGAAAGAPRGGQPQRSGGAWDAKSESTAGTGLDRRKSAAAAAGRPVPAAARTHGARGVFAGLPPAGPPRVVGEAPEVDTSRPALRKSGPPATGAAAAALAEQLSRRAAEAERATAATAAVRAVAQAIRRPLPPGTIAADDDEVDLWSDSLGRAPASAVPGARGAAGDEPTAGSLRGRFSPLHAPGAPQSEGAFGEPLRWRPRDGASSDALSTVGAGMRPQPAEQFPTALARTGKESETAADADTDVASTAFLGEDNPFRGFGSSASVSGGPAVVAGTKDFVARNTALAGRYGTTQRLTADEEARLDRLMDDLPFQRFGPPASRVTDAVGHSPGGHLRAGASAASSPNGAEGKAGDDGETKNDDRAGGLGAGPGSSPSAGTGEPPAVTSSQPGAEDAHGAHSPSTALYRRRPGGGGQSVSALSPGRASSLLAAGGLEASRLQWVNGMLAEMVEAGVASDVGMRKLGPLLTADASRLSATLGGQAVESPPTSGATLSPGGRSQLAAAARLPEHQLRPDSASTSARSLAAPTADVEGRSGGLTLLPFFLTALDEMEASARAAPVFLPPAATGEKGLAVGRLSEEVVSDATGSRPASASTAVSSRTASTRASAKPLAGASSKRAVGDSRQLVQHSGVRSRVQGAGQIAPPLASVPEDGDVASHEASPPAEPRAFGEAAIRLQREERLQRQRMAMVDAALASLQHSFPGAYVGLPGHAADAASAVGSVVGGAGGGLSAVGSSSRSGLLGFAAADGGRRPSSPGAASAAGTHASRWTAGTSSTSYTRKLTRGDIAAEVRRATQQMLRSVSSSSAVSDGLAAGGMSDAALRRMAVLADGAAIPPPAWQMQLAPRERIRELLDGLRAAGMEAALPLVLEGAAAHADEDEVDGPAASGSALGADGVSAESGLRWRPARSPT